MMRTVVDIYGEDTQGTKEAVAMLLEEQHRRCPPAAVRSFDL